MNGIDTEIQFKKEVDDLFANYSHIEETNRGYHIIKEIPDQCILFIGSNPSYIRGATNTSKFNRLEDSSYKYFKKFNKISDAIGIPWSHVDMIFLRETSQNKVKDIISKHPDFTKSNIQLAKRIIESSNPRVIIVCNTLARELLGKESKWNTYQFQFDEEIGTDRITSKESNHNQKAVFFSSMLTGQRALDKGSFERLEWHIKYVLKHDMLPISN